MNQDLKKEKYKLINSAIVPFIIVAFMWLIKLIEYYYKLDFSELGILPLKEKGLLGIITAPFIHENFSHLASNSVPFFVSASMIIYFYKDVALKTLILIYLVTGLWVWSMGRESYHVGASGVVYGYISFIFFSGFIRRNKKLMAVSMLMVFLYGGFFWGVIPKFYPEFMNISWESHLMGGIAGLLFAFVYRKQGLQKEVFQWPEETDEGEDNDEFLDENQNSDGLGSEINK
jgi:membrane associated rhomboid family serine protease